MTHWENFLVFFAAAFIGFVFGYAAGYTRRHYEYRKNDLELSKNLLNKRRWRSK